jgi:hypothetical protein
LSNGATALLIQDKEELGFKLIAFAGSFNRLSKANETVKLNANRNIDLSPSFITLL